MTAAGPPIKELTDLLRQLEPARRDGEYVMVSVDAAQLGGVEAAAMVVEDEGITFVLERSSADELGLDYEFVAAWVTLTVHSALDAVGLTAAVASALSDAGVSCNVIAGFHHDHLLVPSELGERAIEVLRSLR